VRERRRSGEDLSQLTVSMDGQGSAKENAEEKRDGILRSCGSFLACVRMSCSGMRWASLGGIMRAAETDDRLMSKLVGRRSTP
jgi:hypothetical protein